MIVHDPFLKTYSACLLPKSYILYVLQCFHKYSKGRRGVVPLWKKDLLAMCVFFNILFHIYAHAHIYPESCTEQSKEEPERTTEPADMLNPHRKIPLLFMSLWKLLSITKKKVKKNIIYKNTTDKLLPPVL